MTDDDNSAVRAQLDQLLRDEDEATDWRPRRLLWLRLAILLLMALAALAGAIWLDDLDKQQRLEVCDVE